MDIPLDLIGRRVGRYEIRSLLGSGGMGAVYRAYDSNLDRHVAIKILPPHLVADADRVQRFVQEAKSASALNHPHVISIYEVGEDNSLHYIAMELAEGTTLYEHVRGGPLELGRALAIGEQIAEAIGAAHEAGVVHRDLKPENIIIATSGYVKVLDFGLAKLRREPSAIGGDGATVVKSTEPGKLLGTAGYMSPEQAEGKEVDHRSDIFSLGCILYEMVSGRSPFRGRSTIETLSNIVHREPPPLGGPAELQRIVAKTLAKDPADRYQSAKDLAVDLRRLSTRGDGHRGATWRRLSAGAIAVFLVVLVATLLLQRCPRETPAKAAPTITRITSTGTVIGAAISPDGKWVAYVDFDQGQSLHVRQLATGQDLQLVAPAPVGYWGHVFSPDGGSIYYTRKERGNQDSALYSIPLLGGSPRRILSGIDSPVSFSPDGRQIAYVRAHPPSPDSSLVVANADGSNVRILVKRSPPHYFYPIFYAGPSWSPDGTQIAVSMLTRREHGDATTSILAVDARSGAENTVSSGWITAQQPAWLPDGKELIVPGSRGRKEIQLWKVDLASGDARPITNDLLDYRMPTVTADGSTLVAVAADFDADLWRVPLGGGEPVRIRSGRWVGGRGLDVGPDGSIAFVSLDSGTYDLWIADANGANARRLTNDAWSEAQPSFTPDGKMIVFGMYGSNAAVRRIAADGSETRSTEIAAVSAFDVPALSPDGKTVVFRTLDSNALVKMPLAGGASMAITDTTIDPSRPAISPDGTRVACYCKPPPDWSFRLCIVPMAGGLPERTIESSVTTAHSMIRWTRDGKALLVNTPAGDGRNVWRIPLDGSTPEAVTHFTDQLLFSFDLTPDGKSLIVSRGELTRDAVMITGFR